MGEISIRRANEQDFEALDRLYYDNHQYHVQELPERLQDLGKLEEQDWSRLHQALREIFAREDAVIFLAEGPGGILGLAEVYDRRDDEANPLIVPHHYAYLQNLMVSEANRKQGVGRKLVEAAQQWAREKGANEMRLNVWEFNQGTIRFYEKMGFRSLKQTLVIEL